MSIKNFFFSLVLCAAIFIGIDLLWHLVIFSSFYSAAQKGIASPKLNYTFLVASDIYRSLIFSFTYTVFVRKHHSLVRGVLFGACIGLLLASMSGVYYSMFNISNIQWLWYEGANVLIQSLIAGILIPLICWGRVRAKAKSNQNT